MATWNDVRAIAAELPETAETTSYGSAAWAVRGKVFAWDRPLRASDLAALGENAPAGAILGIRTENLEMKEALLAADPAVFFTTPHFDGYQAVLIVLRRISKKALREILTESWLVRAPKRIAEAFLAADHGVRARTSRR